MTTTWPLDPHLRTVGVDVLGRTVPFHPDAAGPARLVVARLERTTRYAAHARARHEAGLVLTGAFNYRPRSSFALPSGGYPPVTVENHSEHAHGCACDFCYGGTVDGEWIALNPLRQDGFLTSDYARFGAEDGAAVMRAWLEPPEGLGTAFFRWAGIDTTDWREAAEVLVPGGAPGTKVVGGDFADAHHFDLIRADISRLRAYDWNAAIAKEEDDLAILSEAEQKELSEFLKHAKPNLTKFMKTLRETLGHEDDPNKLSDPDAAARRVAQAVKKIERES